MTSVDRSTSLGDRLMREAEHYDGLSMWGRPPDAANLERLRLSHALVPTDVASILDFGCGDGASSNALVEDGRSVIGIDPSARALGYAAALGAVAVGDRLPFADRSFDLVMALEVIEHLPPSVLAHSLAEMARVARRHILISTPHREALARFEARCTHCGARFHRNLHHHSFSRADHQQLLDAHGFAHECSEGVEVWRPSEGWARVRRIVGRHYAFAPTLRCPQCGQPGEPPALPPPPLRMALRVVDGFAWRLTRPVPRWLVSRYARVGSPLATEPVSARQQRDDPPR